MVNYTCSPGVVMDDAEQSPELYRHVAAKLRDLASETPSADIKGDLLELAARFERMACYYKAQRRSRPGGRVGEKS
jgi:hypothetical protein